MDARCWDGFFLPFFVQNGYPCYAISLRGHETHRGWWTIHSARMRDYVMDVETAVAQIPESPVLIGHSMGGHVVQKYLQKHDAPAAILMASIPPFGAWKSLLRTLRIHTLDFLRDALLFRRNVLRVSPEQLQKHCFSPDLPRDRLMKYHPRLHLESLPAMLDMLILDRPRTEGISPKTPLLILGAQHDILFHPDDVRITAQALHAPCTIFPDTAHNMMHDVRPEPVAACILDWLSKNGF